ncbi:Hsp70 chaperone [Stygiomarasmius scandens]|uniref:Hsp70 chaperone n=1 Tax=Marasmiellus scandens TaxID=2682957 RepID=A0ABR1IS48_9AGAR
MANELVKGRETLFSISADNAFNSSEERDISSLSKVVNDKDAEEHIISLEEEDGPREIIKQGNIHAEECIEGVSSEEEVGPRETIEQGNSYAVEWAKEGISQEEEVGPRDITEECIEEGTSQEEEVGPRETMEQGNIYAEEWVEEGINREEEVGPRETMEQGNIYAEEWVEEGINQEEEVGPGETMEQGNSYAVEWAEEGISQEEEVSPRDITEECIEEGTSQEEVGPRETIEQGNIYAEEWVEEGISQEEEVGPRETMEQGNIYAEEWVEEGISQEEEVGPRETMEQENIYAEEWVEEGFNSEELNISGSLEKLAIGINLGTTSSSVGIWQNGHVEIITNSQGSQKTPSYITFTDTECVIGDAARDQMIEDPNNIVFDVKRLIGHKFNDPEVQQDMRHLPFNIINKGNRPYIQVEYHGSKKEFSPEEIMSMFLKDMKKTAESHTGHTITKAIITVPAFFNDSQRQAIKDAGTIAGLDVLHIINKPLAAAAAYSLDSIPTKHNVLFFCLGGGTFDVSLITIGEGILQVKATMGDTHLGGEDFVARLVDHFVQEFKYKYKQDLSSDTHALYRLHMACENAKCTLSSAAQASIEINALYKGIDFYASITRSDFEELCQDLFQSTIKQIEKVLCDASIDKSAVHDIVMIGGSTHIPRVTQLVTNFFNGKQPNKSIDPNRAIVCGAAVQAAILTGASVKAATSTNVDAQATGSIPKEMQTLMLSDINSHSLGIELVGGVMSVLIKRGTDKPVRKVGTYTTYYNYQTEVLIQVYEGESIHTKDNNLLGSFTLPGILPAPRGVPQIEVTFDMDANGILNVSAVDKATRSQKQIHVVTDKGQLTNEDIQRMTEGLKKYTVRNY